MQYACLGALGAGVPLASMVALARPDGEAHGPTVAAATEMPKTATRLPLLGTIGFVLLALGVGLAILRRRSLA